MICTQFIEYWRKEFERMLEIYCGNGKGKTTAAVGLSVRAAGHQIKVLFIQFMKNDTSGEITILKSLPTVRVLHSDIFYGFVKNMNLQQREEMKKQYTQLLKEAEKEVRTAGKKEMVIVLDEVIHACNYKLLDEQKLCRFLDQCPNNIEVVLTGREPSEQLQKRADYISNIRKEKHPYDKGILARKGIEY